MFSLYKNLEAEFCCNLIEKIQTHISGERKRIFYCEIETHKILISSQIKTIFLFDNNRANLRIII